MHMILAEHTAIQASTVGSSLMFNRHTCSKDMVSASDNVGNKVTLFLTELTATKS